MSGLLASQQRTALSDAWTITPVGGSDKVTTFVSLLGSQKKMKVATLIDFQKRDQQTIENLYKKGSSHKCMHDSGMISPITRRPKDEE